MMIIKIEAEKSGQHLFQTQSHRGKCWLDGHIEVPKELESVVFGCLGYCDLTIANNKLVDVQGKPELIPTEKPRTEPTANDLINAMLGVTSYE